MAPLAGMVAGPALADPSPIQVAVVRAVTGCVSRLVAASGLTVPRALVAVVAGTPGLRVAALSVHEGDTVVAGQVLGEVAPKDGPAGPGQPLRAPAEGVVMREAAAVGRLPEPGTVLFTIALDGEMEVAAEIFAAHVPEVSAGQGARVRLGDGREFAAHVRLAPVEVDRASQRGEARLSLDGAPALPAGAAAGVRIETRRACGLTLPRAALADWNGGEARVRLVRGGAVELHRVRTGLVADEVAEVVEGLSEGDVVVADGDVALAEGAAVRALPADGADGR